jgi:hypothetical protein
MPNKSSVEIHYAAVRRETTPNGHRNLLFLIKIVLGSTLLKTRNRYILNQNVS